MREKRTPAPDAKAPPLPDAEDRRRIEEELDVTMLVEAAAGTGKTTCMVARMVALLRTGRCQAAELAAVTFTRKAAAELRARFQVGLEQAILAATGSEQERLQEALGAIERCFMGTIHSFCSRLLRERPVEAGVDISFQELDESADQELREAAWQEWMARLVTRDPHGMFARLREVNLQPQDLEQSFLRFCDFPDVSDWPHPPASLPDAAGLRRGWETYLAHIKSVAPRLPEDEGDARLTATYRRLLRMARHLDLERDADLMDLVQVFGPTRIPTISSDLQKEGWRQTARDEQRLWKEFRSIWALPALAAWRAMRYNVCMEALLSARELYDRTRQDTGQLNYQDLLLRAAKLLREAPHVRRYFAHRFTHLLVDEFQDTDPIQAEVMLLLTATDPQETDWRRCRPRAGSLFVVGDPKQSIYRFRRADIQTYEKVKQIIQRGEGKDCPGALLHLCTNFRSHHAIVNWVNRVFTEAFPEAETDASPTYVALENGRSEERSGELQGVHVLTVPKEASAKNEDAVAFEADLVARFIRHAVATGMRVSRSGREAHLPETVTYGDFLLVARKKKHLAVYARTLQALGVPCQVAGGSVLSDVEEIRFLQRCLDAVLHPDNPVLLVGVLRSELFGVSDAELFAFKQAGGLFSLQSSIPDNLSPETHQAFSDGFTRLQRYALWLRALPPVAALERMVVDLGLAVRAGAAPGGTARAGAVYKILEVLRARQAEQWSAAQVAEELARLIKDAPDTDALPLRPSAQPPVRLMNLHKVKGLEAPIVMLIDPTGGGKGPAPLLHVNRMADTVQGFLNVQTASGAYASTTIACPATWNDLAAREQAFSEAEETRLRYVAATRAGAMLVITQRAAANGRNPWENFAAALTDCDIIQAPETVDPETPTHSAVSTADVAAAAQEIEERHNRVTAPTYATGRAKEYALAQATQATLFTETDVTTPIEAGWGEHGVEWGEVVHQLLEAMTEKPDTELLSLAQAQLAEHDMDPSLAQAVMETVQAVLQSEIWQRAAESNRRLSEVPFAMRIEDDTLIRGAMDMVFHEADGWVVVDYKTDRVDRKGVQVLAKRYAPQLEIYASAWEACTGETVKERGFLFTHTGQYVHTKPD